MGVLMALDQSTRCSGWAIFQDGEYICSGVIDKSKSELDTHERSFEMARDLWRVMKKYKPQNLIIEEVSQQTNPKVVIILSRLQGMLIGYAEAHGVKTHILLPSQWRKMLDFKQGSKVKRTELKQQSLDYVKNTFGMELPEDEAEAICIASAAYKIFDLKGEQGYEN